MDADEFATVLPDVLGRISPAGWNYIFNVEDPPERSCACKDFDRFACWRTRYNLSAYDDVVEDGGPCMCSCHDWYDGEDEL